MGRLISFLLFILIVLTGTVAGVYLLVPLIGDLSDESLAHSVAREVETKGELSEASCRKRGKQHFTCRAPGDSGDRPVTYSVRMKDKRCYGARRTSGPGKRRENGCVGLRDQLRVGLLEQVF